MKTLVAVLILSPLYFVAAQQASQPPDIHELVAQSNHSMNRDIALGNRLIAHFKEAQTWEGVDADHPDAVALREKIAREEKEFMDSIHKTSQFIGEIDANRVHKECTKEEVGRWDGLMAEDDGVVEDFLTQRERYHALGY